MTENYQKQDHDQVQTIQRLENDLHDKSGQIKYQNEAIQNLEGTVDQFKDKCFYLEEDVSNKMRENEQLKSDLEKYEMEYLAGSGGEQGSTKGNTLSVTAVRIEAEQLRKDN